MRRLIIVVITLVLVSAFAVQVFLWTDLPRQWVLNYVSSHSGMEVSADSLTTTWGGKTTLTNIALRLASEQDAFVTVNQINLSHKAVALILLTRSAEIDLIRIDEIALRLRQEKSGRWNIEDILPLINELTSKNQAEHKRLPRLDIGKITVKVTERTGQDKKFGPFSCRGEYKNPTVWGLEVSGPGDFEIRGHLTSGKAMLQDVDFTIEEDGELFDILFGYGRRKVLAKGNWYGQSKSGKLTGQLQLEALQIGTADIRGSCDIKMEPNEVLISSKDLVLSDGNFPIQNFKITRGTVRLQKNRFQINHVTVETGVVSSFVNGTWNLQNGKGQFSGSWFGKEAKKGLQHSGAWNCSLDWPKTGVKQVNIQASTDGRSPRGTWEARAEISGSGATLKSSRWQSSIYDFSWVHKSRGISFENMGARFVVDWPEIQLTELRLPSARRVNAQGNFSAKERNWSIALEADKIEIEEPNGQPLNIRLQAEGDKGGITVKDFRLGRDDITVATTGRIILPSTDLEDVRASLRWFPKTIRRASVEPNDRINQWQVDANVAGSVRPFNLALNSSIVGENIALGKRTIPSLSIPLQVNLTPNRVEFNSSESFELLDGACQLGGHYELSSRASHLDLSVEEISLRSIGKVVGSPLLLQGQFTGELEFDTKGFERERFVASGNWNAKDIKIPPFDIERGEGKLHVHDGVVRLEPIKFRHNQGSATGKIYFSLSEPNLLNVELTADKWPVSVSKYNLAARADGNTKIELDVVKRRAQGSGNLSAELLLKDKPLGHITFLSKVKGRTIELQKIKLKALGGTGEGSARIVLDDLFSSNIELKWEDVELAEVTNWQPRLNGLAGKFSGSLTAKKADEPRAFEPLVLELKGQMLNGGYRNIKLDNCSARVYLGKKRFLLDRSIFQFSVGTAQLRGNLSRHAEDMFTHMQVNLEKLDLDQVVRCFDPNVNKVIGLLSGKGMITMFLDFRRSTFKADLELTESDLIDSKIIKTLYGALGLKSGKSGPAGQGRVKLQAEGARLHISSFFYSNRGVEVRGAGTIKDISLGLESPIEGYAVASRRLLKEVNLPGIRDLDKLMDTLHGDVACVMIGGKLGKQIIKTVPFPKISGEFRHLIWSQTRQKTKVE